MPAVSPPPIKTIIYKQLKARGAGRIVAAGVARGEVDIPILQRPEGPAVRILFV